MKIAVGSDHAGFALKQRLVKKLEASGHQVDDVGAFSEESTDYPDYAAAVGRKVSASEADRGLLVCSSGVGMSIAANKIRGVRAALGTNLDEVSFTRRHNDANVLTLGARYTEPELAEQLVDTFLETEFEGGRHARRVQKIERLEQEQNS
jgi:ribose 5-phosphate isomerase B